MLATHRFLPDSVALLLPLIAPPTDVSAFRCGSACLSVVSNLLHKEETA